MNYITPLDMKEFVGGNFETKIATGLKIEN